MAEKKAKDSGGSEIRVPLEYPLKWGEETITEIVLQRPKAKDIKHLGKDVTMDDLLKIASKCSKTEMSKIEELDAEDAVRIADVVGDFLGSGRGTGDSSRS